MLARYRLWVASAVLALALLGTHWGRSVEGATIAEPNFLQHLDLSFRGWKAEAGALSAADAAILQPDDVLIRTYRSPQREVAELTVIAGHRKRTVHTPGYCMVGGGWEVVSQEAREVTAGSQRIPVVRAVMAREGRRLVVTYFFTDGAYSTRNVVHLQAVSLLKRLRADVPVSALVLIVVPVSSDLGAAERLSDAFAAEMVPPVLGALRGARLKVR